MANEDKNYAQLTTFSVGPDLYGIDVMKVQEVTGELPVVPIPLAPSFVAGLVNLRGQIATALDLRHLFERPSSDGRPEASVICRFDGNLVSLLVDSIGDVIEADPTEFEQVPDIVPDAVRRFVSGVFKIDGRLLSVLDVKRLSSEISLSNDFKE